MDLSEARRICKDRIMWKSIASAFPSGKQTMFFSEWVPLRCYRITNTIEIISTGEAVSNFASKGEMRPTLPYLIKCVPCADVWPRGVRGAPPGPSRFDRIVSTENT
ncbi:hypothetical protein EVAR_94494_1 [Eumeta japonica]|uniref:Uncharacterized protein n=1 Tax=Eumeta variegata TaxID=151549 RepID=A0A4C1UW02_EUMVA|nr:hypothetical protein EVAR_94494_1 [Eumeta japonica]